MIYELDEQNGTKYTNLLPLHHPNIVGMAMLPNQILSKDEWIKWIGNEDYFNFAVKHYYLRKLK